METNILQYIKTVMKQKGFAEENYSVTPKLITVDPETTITIPNENDFYFLTNYFTNRNTPDGKIVAQNNGLMLDSINMNTENYKQQYFTGQILITNSRPAPILGGTNDILYLEMLVVTPVYQLCE